MFKIMFASHVKRLGNEGVEVVYEIFYPVEILQVVERACYYYPFPVKALCRFGRREIGLLEQAGRELYPSDHLDLCLYSDFEQFIPTDIRQDNRCTIHISYSRSVFEKFKGGR